MDVTRAVTDSIRAGTSLWEDLVPHHVATEIKQKNLLGHRPQPPQQHGLPQAQVSHGSTHARTAGNDAHAGGLDNAHSLGAAATAVKAA